MIQTTARTYCTPRMTSQINAEGALRGTFSMNAEPAATPEIERYGLLIIWHIVLGFISVGSSTLHAVYVYSVLIWGTARVIKMRNSNGESHNLAAYLVGMEIVNRMVGGLNHEVIKYLIIVVLAVGMNVEKSWRGMLPLHLVAFMLLLLPSVLLVYHPDPERIRQLISFNLSGPFCLAFSGIYFYNRQLGRRQVATMIGWMMLPLMMSLVVVQYRAPSLEEANFSYMMANGEFTGGAGSNQLSTIYGAGILLIGLGPLIGYQLSRFRLLDSALVLLFLVIGLLSFSRGGMIAGGVALLLGILLGSFRQQQNTPWSRRFVTIAVFALLGYMAVQYTNDLTGDALSKRYQGKTGTAGKINYSSGRDRIMVADVMIFLDNPIVGVGPGMAVIPRAQYYGQIAAAHSEITRLLAEHGLLGVSALLILFFTSIRRMVTVRNSVPSLILSASLFAVAYLTMLHNAMRLAIPGFLFGLALCIVTEVQAKDSPVVAMGK